MIRALGRSKLVKDISASTIQTLISQVTALFIFYISSRYLLKSEFGELNWCMAVGSTLIAITSLGLDLVFVKRIASGSDIVVVSGIHLFHTIIAGTLILLVCVIADRAGQTTISSHPVLFFVLFFLGIANVGNSLKLCLNGLEMYRSLAVIAMIMNGTRLILCVWAYLAGSFTLYNLLIIYCISAAVELITGYVIVTKAIAQRVRPLLRVQEYKYFILESLPQLGVVLFDSALARIDWILLGILTTSAVTAEYTFAYKVFELCKIPLIIIAPVFLTRASKILKAGAEVSVEQAVQMRVLFRLNLFIMMIIPIALVCCWSPLLDAVTDNKYGLVNERSFYLLAACIPFVPMINYLWTLAFVNGELKKIMVITIAASVLNILLNWTLIPLYGGPGAALSFLVTTVGQFTMYWILIKEKRLPLSVKDGLHCVMNALASIVAAKLISNNSIFTVLISVTLYCALALLTRQISVSEIKKSLTRHQRPEES